MENKFIHPYYIIAPPYRRTSAGIRVLYKLADSINKSGGSAYIYLRPRLDHNNAVSPMDIAPFLTQKTIDYHFKNGLTPIVIYPETVKVSKFQPPVRVRYLLNYDNFLFENDSLLDDDYLLSYTKSIEKEITVERPKGTLFLLVSDPVFYCPPISEVKREGACFYAGKFKSKFNGKTFPITNGLPEITRDLPNSQTPEEIRTLFQKSEYFYCYEDSALMLEAMLCGCPVIMLPNEHYQKSLGLNQFGNFGYAWGTDPKEIAHAKATVDQVRGMFFDIVSEAQSDLSKFINQTQIIACNKIYDKPFLDEIKLSTGFLSRFIGFLDLIKDSIADRGFIHFMKIVLKRIISGRILLN